MSPAKQNTEWSAMVGLADLDEALRTHIGTIPDSVRSITYSPTGSLMSATLNALYRHVPLTWIDSEGHDRTLGAGGRLVADTGMPKANDVGTTLVLLDTANTASAVIKLRNHLQRLGKADTHLLGAAFATAEAAVRRVASIWRPCLDFLSNGTPGTRG